MENIIFEGNNNGKLSEINKSMLKNLIDARDTLAPVINMVDLMQAVADSNNLLDKGSIGRVSSIVYEELTKILKLIDAGIESGREGRAYTDQAGRE